MVLFIRPRVVIGPRVDVGLIILFAGWGVIRGSRGGVFCIGRDFNLISMISAKIRDREQVTAVRTISVKSD
jgi:hypothetical protein